MMVSMTGNESLIMRVPRLKNESGKRKYPIAPLTQEQQNDLMSGKRVGSSGGWLLIDIVFYILLIGIFLLLVILMSSWLIVGPWRLLGYIVKSLKNIRINQ